MRGVRAEVYKSTPHTAVNISWDPQEDSASEKRISVIVQYAEQGHSSRNIVSYIIVVLMSYVHEANKVILSRQLMSRTRK